MGRSPTARVLGAPKPSGIPKWLSSLDACSLPACLLMAQNRSRRSGGLDALGARSMVTLGAGAELSGRRSSGFRYFEAPQN
jgi:hypothetical protein